jgi:hypothetical protein
MPNVYFKIDEKFSLSDSTEPDADRRPLPVFPRFNEGVFTEIEISSVPQGPGKVSIGFNLGKDDLVSGDFQISGQATSVEVLVQAVFKVSVKSGLIDDVLNPNAKWEFGGLLESGGWNTLKGDIHGLVREEFTRGQGEWKSTFYRHLIGVRAAKTLKELR